MKKLMVFLCLVLLAALGCGRGGDEGKLKVGYVVNYMSHEWYQNICKAARQRAAEMDVDLVIADANLDVAAQISKAENLIAQGVKVLILTPADAKALDALVRQAREAGLYVITESNLVPGSDTYVGIDNKESGKKAGRWYAEYAKANQLSPQILIIGVPNFEDCRLRVEGFKEALAESGIAYQIAQEVDGQGLKEKAFKAAQDALTAHPEVNAIFGINDDSTTGGMAAYQAAGLDEAKLTAIGFGFEGIVGQTALLGHTPYKAALAMFPNFVGLSLVEAAVALGKGETLPPHYETPTTMITLDNFNTFYRQEGQGYVMNFDAIRRLLPAR
ncbi:MAG: substrate-binding domain-containing protein [Candidatus Latescibacteria bacterium]|nr:substrate-binding domain-containing protein [Candidatus Latescibacterota bacterium]